jgi:hypothetical protein
LHGSAASSKTSESLAKETQTLKSGEPETASTGSSGKRYEMALAYRAKGDFRELASKSEKPLQSETMRKDIDCWANLMSD